MTIGIVAVSGAHLIATSDERISFGDVHTATDDKRKTVQIAKNWHATFAASDIAYFPPIIRAVLRKVNPQSVIDAEAMMLAAEEAYSEVLQKDFVARRLSQLGYKSIEEFRRDGFQQLGSKIYGDFLFDLNQADLGVEIIFFGHRSPGQPFVFKLVNPGRAVEDMAMGYSVVGSGSYMALASLRLKRIPANLEATIYRVLEAKFSSETASFVGDTTFIAILYPDGMSHVMQMDEIEEIKGQWRESLKKQVPDEALRVIKRSLRTFD